MTPKIFKYPLGITDNQTIKLPRGAHILSVMNQHDNIVLYALVNDDEKKNVSVSIKIVGTGHSVNFPICSPMFVNDAYKFLGTVSLYGGELMFHVFYKEDV